MKLFRTFHEEELVSLRDRYRNNDLFRHWSPILCQLERKYGGKDAISLWACSEQCLIRLRQVSQHRETEIDYLLRELLQETDVTTAVTIMCIVLVRLMNAVEKGCEDENFDNEPMCIAIMSILQNNQEYKPIYDAITDIFFKLKIGFDGNPVVIQPSDPMHETLVSDDLAEEYKEQPSNMKQEELQKVLEAISKAGITVNGDLVLSKQVENEIGNVEAGGIGIQVNHYGAAGNAPMTASDKDIKAAIEELLEAKDEEGGFLLRCKKHWWAVYRVLSEYCNYPSNMTAFVAKMKELGVAEVCGNRALNYESLKKAATDVPYIAKCSPSAWDTMKDRSDNYRRQYAVAEFLMLKLGIKS